MILFLVKDFTFPTTMLKVKDTRFSVFDKSLSENCSSKVASGGGSRKYRSGEAVCEILSKM